MDVSVTGSCPAGATHLLARYAEALEGRVDHTTVEHTAEVQPEAPNSEIDNIETGVTDEQLAAVKDYVARTTKRPRQMNIATSSPTTVDELMALVRAAQAMLASADTRSTKSTASTEMTSMLRSRRASLLPNTTWSEPTDPPQRVAVADERGRLTAATPAKNPRHRARAARPLSNGRSP